MELKDIKELISFLEKTAFAEVEVREGEVPAPAAPAAAVGPQAETRAPGYDVRIPPAPEPGRVIASPIVGTFYRAAAPDKPPYVEVGGTVKKGQVVCIVEAMKLMNEIESEFEGRIVAVLVDDGEPVEFGQALMRIEP